ncbi:MAG: DUF2505 domain-containing protein [Gammaproteobacteria bacterium]|jgi:hypothetical protein|nr:MAG: DUF2505 domain-containing protein [Gammaproteobacteria bacterium]
MTTSVEVSHEYAHPIETVIGAFTDPDFYLQKFEGIGARDVEVLASDSADGVFTIETRRDVPLDVPGTLKTLLGSWTTVIQNEEWVEGEDGEYLNELEINSEGVPAVVTGSMTLIPTDEGCINEVVIDIACSIPLIGRKLEGFVAESTDAQLDAEYEFIQEYLDEL